MEISAALWTVRLGKDFTFYIFFTLYMMTHDASAPALHHNSNDVVTSTVQAMTLASTVITFSFLSPVVKRLFLSRSGFLAFTLVPPLLLWQ